MDFAFSVKQNENSTLYAKIHSFSPAWLEMHINEPDVNKNIQQICYKASTLTDNDKIAWLLKAISFIDLTSLNGNDTSSTIECLCQKAIKPMDVIPFKWNQPLHTAAVCVYPSRVQDVVATLKAMNEINTIKICSVGGGFPSGQYPLSSRLEEVRCAIEYGAQEIDIVIDRSLALDQEWEKLYDELVAFRKICDSERINIKTILATGELSNLRNVYKASMVAMMAGADFIKTSTGKETVNATLSVGVVMCKAIKDFENLTGRKVGFKPAGGIKTAQDALEWMVLIKEELGGDWLIDNRFRIGASSLLDNIINEIVKIHNTNS